MSVTGDRAKSRPTISYLGLGYLCALPWLQDLNEGVHVAMEAGDGCHAGLVQRYSWRGLL